MDTNAVHRRPSVVSLAVGVDRSSIPEAVRALAPLTPTTILTTHAPDLAQLKTRYKSALSTLAENEALTTYLATGG